MRNKYLIVDFYVDEPACFGVPPFISPYPRYIYAILLKAGIPSENIKYITVDNLRKSNFKITENYKNIYVIGGASVPGKYLGVKIGTLSEINHFIKNNKTMKFIIGGVISRLIEKQDNIFPVDENIESYIYQDLTGNSLSYSELSKSAASGSSLVKLHHDYPDIIAEIETYSGCPRQSHCSFCSESLKSKPQFRDEDDIISEIEALSKEGIRRFRIGRQADILCYKCSDEKYINGFPEPNPEKVISLFKSINELKIKYSFETLNVDNANPGTIINFPEQSKIILKKIADSVTPGDTLPLGVESFDPEVIKNNNLKGTKDGIFKAIQIINEAGSKRKNGLPKLLPGINLIHGLKGETSETFKINYDALKEILEKDLLVKRINIRKLQPYPGTYLWNNPPKISKKIQNRYDYYKNRIRHEIDHPMLKKIYPAGTILKQQRAEDIFNGYTLLKGLSSYSITCKVPYELELKGKYDLIVTDHKERSLSCLTTPVNINTVKTKSLEYINGISKKQASEIFLKRPFSSIEQFYSSFPNSPNWLRKHLTV